MNRSATPLVSGWRTKAKLGVRPRKAIWFWKWSDIKALPWSWARFGQIPTVIGDRELLYQVFSNLVSNAFKYSPDQSMVTLGASAHDGVVEVAVEDRGLGIPRDEIRRIRERYYRASNVGSIPGTGMGLHLVDEIVRQHGGRLEIESEEGKGTRVVVFLPVDGPGGTAERSRARDLVRGGRPG